MEQQEITLGQATYQVSRVYAGTRPASELVAERLAKQISENPPFESRIVAMSFCEPRS